jgi:hypothetical protein
MSPGRGWTGRLREVGDAFLGVVRAELAALAADLSASGRALVRALLLLGAAFGVAFWTIGLLLYFAVELLALALPRWGAVGVVLGVFVIVSIVLLLVARKRLAAIESPASIARRRFADHRVWWQGRVAQVEAAPPPTEPGEGA